MNVSKHGKAYPRRSKAGKPHKDAMAMNRQQTRTAFEAREIDQGLPNRGGRPLGYKP